MAAKKQQQVRSQTIIGNVNDEAPEGVSVLWRPHPGPQTAVFLAQEDEILYGGARGGGKTAAGIVWLVSGNLQPHTRPADVSYINHPNYRALVLRRNLTDMGDWIDKAKRIYGPIGAEFRERPLAMFEFPTGAKIILGHLDDKDAYEKYLGQEFHRLLLEEATLVPDLKSYKMVLTCLRSVYPELRTQALLTANPGNAGHGWVRDRFVKAKDASGAVVPPNTRINDKATGKTRIYIPARLSDNPALEKNDPGYIKNLLDLDPSTRRAMLDGDWDALSGLMLSEFRATGPMVGEPMQARHVIPSKTLSPWLNRFIGMDWGYAHEGAVYWGCDNDDQRTHIYREMVRSGMGAESWGAEIALATLEDLRGLDSGVITMYLSPDAWDKRNDQRAIADQIGQGIAHVLGPQSAIVLAEDGVGGVGSVSGMAYTDNKGTVSEFITRMEEQQRFGIIVRKAANQRVAGVQYIRSLLRWWPITTVEVQRFDQKLFMRLLQVDASRAMDYRDACERQSRPETLPGVLIHDCCPMLIESLLTRARDEKNPEDVMKLKEDPLDNVYDGFRYAVFSHSKETIRAPLRVQMEQRMAMVAGMRGGELDGNVKCQVAQKLEADFAAASASGEPFYIPRLSSRRAKQLYN
jgi:hypothetical protein